MSVSRTGSIRIDEEEYIAIVKRKIREDLRRYLGTGRVTIDSKEGKLITISVDEIEIPSWRYGFPDEIDVGRGEGKPGTDLGPVEPAEDDDKESGGQGHGSKKLVIDLTEEFAEYFQEALELPKIKPKGDRTVLEEREKYNTLSRKGPHSMIHLRRTLLEALKRAIAEGEFKPPEKTLFIPRNDDLWFKSFEVVLEPKNNAVLFFMRDVSGSMGPEERKTVSYLCDLCEYWLSFNYDRLEKVYIIHDDRAEEVPRARFFTEDWGGGTICSSALTEMHKIIEERFPITQWNIYPIYLSDGFNFTSDNEVFLDILGTRTLPVVNQFNYGQIELHRPWFGAYAQSGASTFSAPGTLGDFIEERFKDVDNVALAEIGTGEDDSAVEAIRIFFGKGN